MTKTKQAILSLGLVGALSVGLSANDNTYGASQGAGNGAQSAGNIQQKLNQIESEYVQVTTRIKDIEQKALSDETVEEAQNDFETKLDQRMLETNPELEEKMIEREKYSEYIDRIQAGESVPENVDVNEVYTRYNAIQQEIIPVRQKAIQNETVREAYEHYQELLVDRMMEIDPQVNDYFRLQNELVAEYQNLMGQAQSQGQGG